MGMTANAVTIRARGQIQGICPHRICFHEKETGRSSVTGEAANSIADVIFSGLLADVGQDAAVHIEDVSVDKVGGVGGQEHRRAHQVLRVAPAAGRSFRDNELVKGAALAAGGFLC